MWELDGEAFSERAWQKLVESLTVLKDRKLEFLLTSGKRVVIAVWSSVAKFRWPLISTYWSYIHLQKRFLDIFLSQLISFALILTNQ